MPTISPALIASVTSCSAGWPASSSALRSSISSRGAPNSSTRGGALVSSCAPIIMPAMASGVSSATRPLPARRPRRRIVTSSANAITSRNLWVIIRMVSSLRLTISRSMPEHFVGLAGREHRGRLVEDEKTALQIELLEDLAFLPLAGRDRRHLGAERNAERHAVEKGLELGGLLAPVHHGGKLGARQHEILGHGHGRDRGEVLVDHAEAERMRGARVFDRLLAVVDQDAAGIRVVIAHDAFDQRALAGAVLAQQRVEAAGRHLRATRHRARRTRRSAWSSPAPRRRARGREPAAAGCRKSSA